jgi:hypothetical protein
MGNVINFPISLDSDICRELIVDCARYSEGLLTEKEVKKKHRFDDGTWERLGQDDALVEAIEAEKLRRVRSGLAKRELAQKHVVKAPERFEHHHARSRREPETQDRLGQGAGPVRRQRTGCRDSSGQIRNHHQPGK